MNIGLQHSIYARLANLKPEMDDILKELKEETDRAVVRYRWDAKTAKLAFHEAVNKIPQRFNWILKKTKNSTLSLHLQAEKQWDLLVQRDNCHYLKATVLLWGQIPLWVCMSVALRNMAMMLPVQTIGISVHPFIIYACIKLFFF